MIEQDDQNFRKAPAGAGSLSLVAEQETVGDQAPNFVRQSADPFSDGRYNREL